ncbi:MAG: hypothetical protein KatS3mg124_2500 [Porticoccaceae bacterium]|nr:MAG: hypothetical protein KatS3mg124_2500 [Porticoccaceae bacterium]
MRGLAHGGRLAAAARESGIPPDRWLDLSTGISPWSWPVPALPQEVFQRLPEADGALEGAAAAYYGLPRQRLLPVPGSQWALGCLPQLVERQAAALPRLAYAEHGRAWRRAGHRVLRWEEPPELEAAVVSGRVAAAVVVQPENPTARTFDPQWLLFLAERLKRRGGLLVVDEAFVDPFPELSLAPRAGGALVVLRSLGKFFGLAGLRLGFALAAEPLLRRLARRLDPWAVSGPARWVGARALADMSWQRRQRARLAAAGAAWRRALALRFGAAAVAATPLFTAVALDGEAARRLDAESRRRALLLRFYARGHRAWARLGLPPEGRWQETLARLEGALRAAEVGR